MQAQTGVLRPLVDEQVQLPMQQHKQPDRYQKGLRGQPRPTAPSPLTEDLSAVLIQEGPAGIIIEIDGQSDELK